jgi:hypothetical protein
VLNTVPENRQWLLRLELDGSCEECTFRTEWEAQATFSAVVLDYEGRLSRAILVSPSREELPVYVN